MSEEPRRPSSWDIVFEYLQEGYRAWQARDRASAATVRDRMALSADEDSDFRLELEGLGLIALAEMHADAGTFRLLPRGIALMDGSPALDSLLALPSAALDRAAPDPETAESAKRGWRSVVLEWALKKGLDVAWDNQRVLWEMLRARYPWLPALPGGQEPPV